MREKVVNNYDTRSNDMKFELLNLFICSNFFEKL